jgi:2-oxoisovalerate dehydrogenase E1 component
LDEKTLQKAVTDTHGKAVILHEANWTRGFGAEISARLHEMLDEKMRLTVTRVTTPDVRMLAAPVLAEELLPNASHVVEALREMMSEN